jgi:hypothetical protein
MVAFAFGLLHGFGFASGLTTTGIPQSELPLALLSFNGGVELGQMAFVALILLLLKSFRVLEMRWPVWVQRTPGYVVGVCGAYWTIERTAALFAMLQMKQKLHSRVECVALTVFALAFLVPATVQAHPQKGSATGFLTGFEHPLSGWDHILAMVAVGLWVHNWEHRQSGRSRLHSRWPWPSAVCLV